MRIAIKRTYYVDITKDALTHYKNIYDMSIIDIIREYCDAREEDILESDNNTIANTQAYILHSDAKESLVYDNILNKI